MTNANAANVITAIAATFQQQFNFKNISKEAYESLYDKFSLETENKEAFYARIESQFDFPGIKIVKTLEGEAQEINEKNYAKRKPVVVSLNFPEDLVESLALASEESRNFAVSAIQSQIAEYVKDKFVDGFAPEIGDHSLAAILRDRASTGSRGGLDPALLDHASESLYDYALTVAFQGNVALAKAFKTLGAARFARSAVTRAGIERTPERIERLKARIDGWLEFVGQTTPEALDDFSRVYTIWTNQIDKLLEADVSTDMNAYI